MRCELLPNASEATPIGTAMTSARIVTASVWRGVAPVAAISGPATSSSTRTAAVPIARSTAVTIRSAASASGNARRSRAVSPVFNCEPNLGENTR